MNDFELERRLRLLEDRIGTLPQSPDVGESLVQILSNKHLINPTINGGPLLGDWFDQSVKTTATPLFNDLTLTAPGKIFCNVDWSMIGLYGGTDGLGAWIGLYGGTHATNAKSLWFGADYFYWRNQADSAFLSYYNGNWWWKGGAFYWRNAGDTAYLAYHDGSNMVMATGALYVTGGNIYSYGAYFPGNQATNYINYAAGGNLTGLYVYGGLRVEDRLFLGNNNTYYMDWDAVNTSYRVANAGLIVANNIYWGTKSVWLSDWFGQALLTSSAPQFAYLGVGVAADTATPSRILSKGTSTANTKYSLFCQDSNAGCTFYVRDDNLILAGVGWITDVYTHDGGVHSQSDERLKENIRPFKYGLREILQLEPITYKFKEGNSLKMKSGEDYHGFSAQAVQRVIPDAVHLGPHPWPTEEEKDNPYLVVNWGVIHTAVIQAVKDLDKRLKALEA